MIAYDLISKQVVVIAGETETQYILSDGTPALKWDITKFIPDWALAEYAAEKAADLLDEHDTQADGLGTLY